jgi:hypothetical protein
MGTVEPLDRKITPAQLRQLHLLWRAWAGKLSLSPQADRALRHYYVRCFSEGRASQTMELSRADAGRVLDWLQKLVHPSGEKENRAAGTAGRQGYPEQRRVKPNAPAWRALYACVRALRWNRAQLEAFVRRHYANVGLHSVEDIRTMADLNRVLWGLKAMLRRGPGPARAVQPSHRKAA